jgi:N-acetylglucosamine kinase-like BadF-type ATPase
MGAVMALDGGGTKTVAAIAAADGRVLALAVAGASNPGFTPLDHAEAAVRQAIAGALAQAGVEAGDVRAIAASLSGAMKVDAIVRDLLPAARLELAPEWVSCLASAYESERGAVVLSGTGAFEWAIGPAGAVHTDGYGALLGDEGSAYWLARAGFTAAGRALDGRGPATALAAPLGPMARDLYRRGQSMQRHEVAAAAPVVTAAALEGDAVARAVCRLAAQRLARGLRLCMSGAGILRGPATVALAGSVLRSSAAVREPLVAMIAAFAPQARAIVPVLDPVRGGLLVALRLIGQPWDAAVRAHLERSMTAFAS